jgi:hypothetical protein
MLDPCGVCRFAYAACSAFTAHAAQALEHAPHAQPACDASPLDFAPLISNFDHGLFHLIYATILGAAVNI